jgi:NAD(P)-dependent dehydrogenase (short-subunit alcohol dehydrogenase family)
MSQAYPFPVSSNEFAGGRVLVTGGTKGVGQAIVQRFQLAGVRDQCFVERRFDSVVAHAFDLDDGIARIYFLVTDRSENAGRGQPGSG